MKIEEQIKIDVKKSMFGRNTDRTTLLRTILGEFNRIGKDIPDEKALSIMKKMKANAEAQSNQFEIEILSEYLPKLLSKNETIFEIEKMLKTTTYTVKDIGLFMKEVKSKFGQSINMKNVSEIFKSRI
jgi:uncharacterized protein YqeY